MKEIGFDIGLREVIKNIVHRYESEVPKGMFNYYKDILSGNNTEMYMQTYSLSKEKLIKYARICKIIDIYKQMNELLEILKSEIDELNKEDALEYQIVMNELQNEASKTIESVSFFDDDSKKETINSKNLVMYPKYIDESRERTLNAKSGREEQTQKAVASLIEQLRLADYQSLRKKGYIHQNQIMGKNKECYVGGNAYERFGSGSTKVCYIRIPISDKNARDLKEYYNIDFDMLYLITYYGDFKNEGHDEIKFYAEVYSDLKKHYDEILRIIDLFVKDFTPDTLSEAIDFIDNGFRVTNEITEVIKDKTSNL